MAKQTKTTLERTNLDVIADRGYFSSEEILECDKAGIAVTLPKPMTSNPQRFGKQDFRYVAEEDVYICPAGERLTHSFTLVGCKRAGLAMAMTRSWPARLAF